MKLTINANCKYYGIRNGILFRRHAVCVYLAFIVLFCCEAKWIIGTITNKEYSIGNILGIVVSLPVMLYLVYSYYLMMAHNRLSLLVRYVVAKKNHLSLKQLESNLITFIFDKNECTMLYTNCERSIKYKDIKQLYITEDIICDTNYILIMREQLTNEEYKELCQLLTTIFPVDRVVHKLP